jgi:hypothetical protein
MPKFGCGSFGKRFRGGDGREISKGPDVFCKDGFKF